MNSNRRKVIARALGAAGLVGATKAFATPEDVEMVIKGIAGDADISQGALKLNAPEIAENGNSVPISVSVDGPVSEDLFVESVTVLAEGNPNPEVITFNFSAASGEVFASTRMRLAQSQNVVAVAKMSDGTVMTDTRNVKVTIGGCGG